MTYLGPNNLAVYFQQFSTEFPNHDGTVRYATASVNPSNSIGNRVLCLTMEGILLPNEATRYEIKWDFSNVATDRTISLEGPIEGQVNIGCKTFSAKRLMNYDASKIDERILTLFVNVPKPLSFQKSVFLNIQINDLGIPAPGTRTCNVLNNVIQQIENQLNAMFPVGGPVSAVYINLTVGNQTESVEVLSDSDLTVSTSSFDLLPILEYPSEISILGSANTWDNITFLASPNSSNAFFISLKEAYIIMLSSTGFPVCSNAWEEVYYFVITDFTLKNFFDFSIQHNEVSCTPLNNSKVAVTYTIPFIFVTSPTISLSFEGKGETGTGFCNYKDFLACANNLSEPCPDDQIIVSETANGVIGITTTFNANASLTFTSYYNDNIQNYVIDDIQITNVQSVNFTNTVFNYNINPKGASDFVINILGGEQSIIKKVSAFAQKELNGLTNQIVNGLNKYLATQVITL